MCIYIYIYTRACPSVRVYLYMKRNIISLYTYVQLNRMEHVYMRMCIHRYTQDLTLVTCLVVELLSNLNVFRSPVVGFGCNCLMNMNPGSLPYLSKQLRTLKFDQKAEQKKTTDNKIKS